MGAVNAAWLEGSKTLKPGLWVELGEVPLRIGASITCRLRLEGGGISAEHAEIRVLAGGYVIKDLGSSLGTRLNGQRILEAPLADGDRIQLGDDEFIFRVGMLPAPPPRGTVESVSTDAPVPPPPFKDEPDWVAGLSSPTQAAPPPPDEFGQPASPSHLAYSVPPAASIQPPQSPATAVPVKRSRRKKVLFGCGALFVLSLCACATIFVLASLGSGDSSLSSSSSSSATLDLASALAVKTPDERAEVLARLGLPDAFMISDQAVTGGNVRCESWHYNQFGLRVDFVDGQIAWTVDADVPSPGGIYPAWYNPLDFEIGMSQELAASLVTSRSPAGSKPQAIDLAEGGEDLVGTTMLAGDQILMGFYNGKLVYVETLALLPEEGAQ